MQCGEKGEVDTGEHDGRDGSLSDPVSISVSHIADARPPDGGDGRETGTVQPVWGGARTKLDVNNDAAEIRMLHAQVSALRAQNQSAAGRGPGPSSAHPRAGTLRAQSSGMQGVRQQELDASGLGSPVRGHSSQGSKGPAMSPAQQRAEEIQRVLQEARAKRVAADHAKWLMEKLSEGSPPDWKSIVRHHLSANGDKVDEIRVAREAWMLERHHGSGGGTEALGKLSKELVEMRQILASIAHTLPLSCAPMLPTSLGLSFNSQSSAPSLAPSLEFNTPSTSQNCPSPPHLAHPVVGQAKQPLLVLSQSQMQHLAYDEAQDLVLEAEEVYKKLFGKYPSRQGLVDFCAEVLRINISPFLPKHLPERSSLAQRSLSELNSVEMSPLQLQPESSQCWVCGSPMGKRGRCQRRSPSPNNFCLSHDVSRSSSDIMLGEPFLSPERPPLTIPEKHLQPLPLSLVPGAASHESASKASTATAVNSVPALGEEGPKIPEELLQPVAVPLSLEPCAAYHESASRASTAPEANSVPNIPEERLQPVPLSLEPGAAFQESASRASTVTAANSVPALGEEGPKIPEQHLQPVPVPLEPGSAHHESASKASAAPAAHSESGLTLETQVKVPQKAWNKSEFTPPVSPDPMKSESETSSVAKSYATHPFSAASPPINSKETATITQQLAFPALPQPPPRGTWYQVSILVCVKWVVRDAYETHKGANKPTDGQVRKVMN